MKKLVFIFCLFLFFQCSSGEENRSVSHCKKCSDFKSSKAVKKYLATHPECRKQFDRDHDGKPCESIKD